MEAMESNAACCCACIEEAPPAEKDEADEGERARAGEPGPEEPTLLPTVRTKVEVPLLWEEDARERLAEGGPGE